MYKMDRLDMFFKPRSIAIIGASSEEKKLGYAVLKNVIDGGYKGNIYPINPKADYILGYKCYKSVLDIPDDLDLVVFVIPSKFVNPVMRECAQKGVKGAIVITAGFKETGLEGAKLERELKEIVKSNNIRLVGPNVLGLIDTHNSINASFASFMPKKGNIGFISQSGAFATAIMDWAAANDIGFSKFISIGNKADVNEIDLLEVLKDDNDTDVILMYLESIDNGRAFMDIAYKTSKVKPIIVLKSGTTAAGAKAATSHTGSLAGSDQAYTSAFKQCGVIRASTVEDLFDLAIGFAYQPLLNGNNIAIITNAGGPGIMASDAIENFGLRLATLSNDTVEELRKNLPSAAAVYNPVDVLGDALADRYEFALSKVLRDENVDGAMVILTPQVYTQVNETAESIVKAKDPKKPIFSIFMGGKTISAATKYLMENSVPNYSFPERAGFVFKSMHDRRIWLNKPEPVYRKFDTKFELAEKSLRSEDRSRRPSLGDWEVREVFEGYGFTLPKTLLATTSLEASDFAEELGFPVVMKIASPDILHKTDVGGVKVGLRNKDEVIRAFDDIMISVRRYFPDAEIWGVSVQQMLPPGKDVIIGSVKDPQFGHMIMFGLGGIYVEVLKDVSFRIVPVSESDAMNMIREIKSFKLLSGARGEKGVDQNAIVDAILRVSNLVTDFPEIVELDINPLRVFEEGAVAIDMRLTVGGGTE
ncbi:acetyl coenzyme A synthetase (ADP forming), alpha domain protein [Thermodesulfobium narugense DSM 14796]|uniref:Acetyl coenzyme A synthetase (ADP forming), alpha domain protein n=2 Tax=Thermodesulfobium narugense TaxID=184064 RepID=M1E6Y4_9BACT|nr:acetyl coenzyme A synthetase (ADP forming), alpha domain protein [Thermodesulfobium narugense DSM 14796]